MRGLLPELGMSARKMQQRHLDELQYTRSEQQPEDGRHSKHAELHRNHRGPVPDAIRNLLPRRHAWLLYRHRLLVGRALQHADPDDLPHSWRRPRLYAVSYT